MRSIAPQRRSRAGSTRFRSFSPSGRIAVGLDADLAIVDLDREYRCRREDVRSGAGYSIYEGRRFKGKVEHTLVRGRFVLRDATLIDAAVGTGRYISRAL